MAKFQTTLALAWTTVVLLFMPPDVLVAGTSCKATSVFGSDCEANCTRRDRSQAVKAVCRGGVFSADCGCVTLAVASTIGTTGMAISDTQVRVDVYDISCDTLPCDPVLRSNTTVIVSDEDTPFDFSQKVVDSLPLPEFCSSEVIVPLGSRYSSHGVGVAFRMVCDDFMPKFLICEDLGGPCPDVFEIFSGTDPDIHIGLGGFSFLTEEVGQPTTTCINGTINSSFEEPRLTPGVPDFEWFDESQVPGWETTASDDLIEFWTDDFGGFSSYAGFQHVEINATQPALLSQDIIIPSGEAVCFEFAHRARFGDGLETLRLYLTDLGADGTLGGGDDTELFSKLYSSDNTDWTAYSSDVEPPVIALGNAVRISFDSQQPDNGGNLIDGIVFGYESPTGPTCGDGDVNALFEQCDDGNEIDGDGCDNNCRFSILTPPNTCDSAVECVFDGFLNQAIGDATLSLLQDDTVLLVDNIGSTGLDGVRQFVPSSTEMRTDLVRPNFSQSIIGTELVTAQIGIVDGMGGQLFSTLTITNDGENLQVVGDWSPIGNTSYNIRIYLDQTLITDQRELSNGLLTLPIQDIGGLDCDVSGELTGDTDPPVLITIPGRGDFFADNWVIATEDASSTAEAQVIIEMLASNTGPIQILHEFTTPPPSPSLHLFSDGFESGDTSAWSLAVGE